MRRALLGIVVFVIAILLLNVYIGEVLTRISGQSATPSVAISGVNPEAGESIFWGKGKCHTCHSIGRRGSSIRGPNQGDSGPLGLLIGARAAERAKERGKQGVTMEATDFLVESIATPSAYVVEGSKDEMPKPYLPPIALKPDEVRAVITYLQSQGGTADPAAIKLAPQILAAAKAGAIAEKWEPYIEGDPESGKELFFDSESPAACAKCHKVGDDGGEVGPELTSVAGTRTPKFIVESVLDPSKEIASGYESILIVTKDGRYITGILKKEGEQTIEIADEEGTIQSIGTDIIAQKAPQTTSLMPGNFSEILTMQQFHDVLAYLMTLE